MQVLFADYVRAGTSFIRGLRACGYEFIRELRVFSTRQLMRQPSRL